ncbi:hypothetical protein [uncultured Fibrella sp.]|uniref:hypothetical protein n=1 Tax=uncultured Fibrella sp. TaxID=1284596 RepID=UPI0035CB5A4A
MKNKNQKLWIKSLLLTASLVVGATMGQSLVNEAQALGKAAEAAGCLKSSNPNTMNYCCACGGSSCFGVCC